MDALDVSHLSNDPFDWQGQQDHACLLLHGLGGGIYELYPLAKALHQYGYGVKGINYPGHQHPAKQMPASCWTDWYSAAESAYLELCARGYRRITLVGFCLGSLLALKLAQQQAKRHQGLQLVLLSPFLRVRHQWYYGLRPETYTRILGGVVGNVPRFQLPLHDPVVRQAAHRVAYYRTFNVSAVRSALELIRLVEPTLGHTEQPVLVAYSRQDKVICPQAARQLYDQLGSADKTLVELTRSNHILPLDVERDYLWQMIAGWIEGHRNTDAPSVSKP